MRTILTTAALLLIAGVAAGCQRPASANVAEASYVQLQPDPVEALAAKCRAEAPMHRSDDCVAMEISLLEKAQQNGPAR